MDPRKLVGEASSAPVYAAVARVSTIALWVLVSFGIGLAEEVPLPYQPPGNENPQILVFHSYHAEMGWTRSISEGIESVVSDREFSSMVHQEFMDTKLITSDRYFAVLRELYREKYRYYGPRVILTSDDSALYFMLSHGRELFPGTPLVFCGVNEYDPSIHRLGIEITGVTETTDPLGTLRLISEVHPRVDRVALIFDQTHYADQMLHRPQWNEIEEKSPVPVVRPRAPTLGALIDTLNTTPGETVALFVMYTNDEERSYTSPEALGILYAGLRIPIYGLHDGLLGQGIVGGMLSSGFEQGRIAASMTLRIMQGERASDIPVMTEGSSVPMFDEREMDRWGISESDLPPGSIVTHRSFTSQYRGWFYVGSGFAAVELLIIIGLLVNWRTRVQVERRLNDTIAIMHGLGYPLIRIRPDNAAVFLNNAFLDFTGAPELLDVTVAGARLREIRDSYLGLNILDHIPADQHGAFERLKVQARETRQEPESRFRIGASGDFSFITFAGNQVPVRFSINYARNSDRFQVSISDISELRAREEEQERRIERIKRQQAAVARLALSEPVALGDVEGAGRLVLPEVVRAMSIASASFRMLDDQETKLGCVLRYRGQTDEFSSCESFLAFGCPEYFATMDTQRTIAISDTTTDPRVDGFADDLLKTGILAVIDAPVRVSGRVVGVVSLEHDDGVRVWQQDEVSFASEIADLFAQVMLNAQRRAADLALRESEQNLAITLNSIADAVIATDVHGTITRMNPVAEVLTGWDAKEATGRDLLDVFRLIDPEKRSPHENSAEMGRRGGRSSRGTRLPKWRGADRRSHRGADTQARRRSGGRRSRIPRRYRAASSRRAGSPVAEDGIHRSTRRRDRSRFQQPPQRHPGVRGAAEREARAGRCTPRIR